MSQVFGLPVSTITGLPCLKTIPQVRTFGVVNLHKYFPSTIQFLADTPEKQDDKLLLLNLLYIHFCYQINCPNCERTLAASRFAPHQLKCKLKKKEVQYIIGLNQVCSPPREVHGDGQKLKQSRK